MSRIAIENEMMGTWIGWSALARAYICGEPVAEGLTLEPTFPTLRELGAQCGISYSKIGRRAKREGWLQERRRFQAKLREEMCRIEARRAISMLESTDEV
jgi:hypothetical protein